jgi:hypothetical protein
MFVEQAQYVLVVLSPAGIFDENSYSKFIDSFRVPALSAQSSKQ